MGLAGSWRQSALANRLSQGTRVTKRSTFIVTAGIVFGAVLVLAVAWRGPSHNGLSFKVVQLNQRQNFDLAQAVHETSGGVVLDRGATAESLIGIEYGECAPGRTTVSEVRLQGPGSIIVTIDA